MSLPKVAIVDFKDEYAVNIADIIAKDLNITGEFNTKKYKSLSEVESSAYYVIDLTNNSSSARNIVYSLSDNIKSKVLMKQDISFKSDNMRQVAHTVSNSIYKQLTGIDGVFTSHIAYSVRDKGYYKLVVADYDGYNPKVLLKSKFAISSLAWSNRGDQIAYVSLETGKPTVYVQDIYQPRRTLVASFKGSNSSPVFIPNSSQLLVTLTKDEGSHIYLINNKAWNSNSIARLFINFGSIDTEASISSDGNVVFTSNHDGGPQIFMVEPRENATPVRITLDNGNYNTTARFSHDGTKLVFINRSDGVLKTNIFDLKTNSSYPISVTNHDLAPTFAPNDKLVLFSSDSQLFIANSTGTFQTKIDQIDGSEVIDQSWGI